MVIMKKATTTATKKKRKRTARHPFYWKRTCPKTSGSWVHSVLLGRTSILVEADILLKLSCRPETIISTRTNSRLRDGVEGRYFFFFFFFFFFCLHSPIGTALFSKYGKMTAGMSVVYLFIYTMFLAGNTFSSNSHSTKWPSIKDV